MMIFFDNAKKSWATFSLLCLFCLVLIACSFAPPTGGGATPTVTVDPSVKLYQHRAKITALFCDDTTGSYDREFFNAAKKLMAASFVSAVLPNQDGITLYVATISYDPVTPNNSLDPLTMSAIPAYPTVLTPQPYPTFDNDLSKQATQIAVDKSNNQAATNYNKQVAAIDQQVQATATSVKASQVNRLLNWNPPEDNRGTSVYGCLYLVKDRLQPTSDIKQLFIASDLENNVTTQLTNDFIQEHGLKNVSVHVIYLPGADDDKTKRANWCQFFTAAGATAVRYDDTATSATLSDLFDADLTPKMDC